MLWYACVFAGLRIFLNEEDITAWFDAAADAEEKTYDKVTVSRKTATSIEGSFSSGKVKAVLFFKACYIT